MYNAPEAELVLLAVEDILTTSNDDGKGDNATPDQDL